MHFDDINVLIDIAKTNNMKKTASNLSVSPDSVRDSLARIENYVGKRLFYKTNKGTFLTSNGLSFLDSFTIIMNTFNSTLKSVTDPSSFSIAIPELFSNLRTYSPVIYDNLNLSIINLSYDECYNAIIHEIADFTVMFDHYNFRRNKKIQYIPLPTDKLCLVSHKTANITLYKEIDVSQIHNQIIYYDSILVTPVISGLISKFDCSNTVKECNFSKLTEVLTDNNSCFLCHYFIGLAFISYNLDVIPIFDTEDIPYLIYKDTDNPIKNKTAKILSKIISEVADNILVMK